MSAPAQPPGGGAGYNVVAEQLSNLLPVFEALEDVADQQGGYIEEHTSISGEQTGPKCCPEAGDALQVGLQKVVSNFKTLGTHALDIRGAVQATVLNYESAEQAATEGLNAAGSGL